MLEENGGSGEGECGKLICVIGMGLEGMVVVVMVEGGTEENMGTSGGTDGKIGGTTGSANVTTLDAVRSGTPPEVGAGSCDTPP
jgi:hypothetical protein